MTSSTVEPEVDPYRPELASRAEGLLAAMNRAGVLAAVDVHLARTLSRLAGDPNEDVLLAAALASRAPRMGHVRVELASVHATVITEDPDNEDLDALAWPPLERWLVALRASPLVTEGLAPSALPLRLYDGAVYLDRHWRHERLVASELRARAGRADLGVELTPGTVDAGDEQAAVLAAASRRALTVVVGGPGTGKTTTVARLLAALGEQAVAAGRAFPRVALAAPTGKAANRVEASVAAAAEELAPEGAVRQWLRGLSAATVQRLLGAYGTGTRFRHDHANPLPHDVVVIDEASMVAVALMARLLDAVRPAARLVIVGDPDQLASIEAGAVLGDVVAGALEPAPVDAGGAAPGLAEAVVVLHTSHRFAAGSGIAALAGAVRAGDADAALTVLCGGREDLRWLDLAEADRDEEALADVRDELVAVGTERHAAAAAGAVPAALAALDRVQVVCAHRRGPAGSRTWGERITGWLGASDPVNAADWGEAVGGAPFGTPVMVTANDYALGLFNGDIGVVVDAGGARRVAFGPAPAPRLVPLNRLEAIETVHATTIHKSQGSEFSHVIVVLPDEGSRLLTRELLYTAVTRAREHLTVVSSEAALRQAIDRRVRRASGLRTALWGGEPDTPARPG